MCKGLILFKYFVIKFTNYICCEAFTLSVLSDNKLKIKKDLKFNVKMNILFVNPYIQKHKKLKFVTLITKY